MDQTVRKLPVHEVAYQQLREMILFGEIAPGQAVTIQGLIGTLGVGMTPVREALRRLTAEGALQAHGNRRIGVPELDLAQLEELAFARLAIEPELARRAVGIMKTEDIEELEAIDAALNVAIARGDVSAYLRCNHQFHMTMYEGACAPLLTGLVGALWLRFGPSLRVVCGLFGTLNLPDRHRQALDALRAGDPGAVAEAIRDDLEQGVSQVRQSLLNRQI